MASRAYVHTEQGMQLIAVMYFLIGLILGMSAGIALSHTFMFIPDEAILQTLMSCALVTRERALNQAHDDGYWVKLLGNTDVEIHELADTYSDVELRTSFFNGVAVAAKPEDSLGSLTQLHSHIHDLVDDSTLRLFQRLFKNLDTEDKDERAYCDVCGYDYPLDDPCPYH